MYENRIEGKRKKGNGNALGRKANSKKETRLHFGLAMQAAKQVFGCDVVTPGCIFHSTQATGRRIEAEGLTSMYKT